MRSTDVSMLWCAVGMLSHQLLQHVIDGKKAIIQNPTEAQRSISSTPCPKKRPP